MKFRPDIDGLRGVAVLLVVAYHARLPLLPAGYVGVDVFLVISGYLITGMLLGAIDTGRFSAPRFFTRRVRRLMPAAVVMCAATLLTGCFVLSPQDLRTLAGSALAVLTLVPNFFFWAHQGYFADQVPEQALLHTWSLGLEEQFYLLYPLALLWLARRGPRVRLAVCTASAVLCFVFSAWLTGIHAGAAFYMLPARAWEFLAGALVALHAPQAAPRLMLRSALGLAGLALVLLAGVALTPGTPYPGVAALLPVTGSALTIWAGSASATASGRLLRARWLVAVGAGSYSLYLWHWPALTLARYYAGRELHPAETLAVLAFAALAAFLSYRWIERPFRLGAVPGSPPRPLGAMVALAAVIVLGSGLVIGAHGFPGRLSAAALTYDSARLPEPSAINACHQGPPAAGTLCSFGPRAARTHILVWGDSHANAVVPALVELGARHSVLVTQASYSGCPPLLEVRVAHVASAYCLAFNARVLRAIPGLGLQRVLLVGYWAAYLPERPEPLVARWLDPYRGSDYLAGGDAAQNERNFAVALRQTVETLEHLGVEVWIMRQVPNQAGPVPWELSRAATLGGDIARLGITREQYRRSQTLPDAEIAALGAAVRVIDPAMRLCGTGICVCAADGHALYIDSNHLSLAGAQLIEPLFDPLLR